MTRSLRILYIALFLAILLSLGLWSLGGLLSFKPVPDNTILNGRFAHAAEQHYDAEFPLKRIGTNLWAALDFKVFGEGRPGVVLGRDQWLYTDEEFNPIANGEEHVKENMTIVQNVSDELKAHGVKLVMAVVPAKARLYPEHIGKETPTPKRAELYQQFHATLQQAGIIAPDFLGPFQQAKQNGQLFLRTDTHWTPMGADLAAKLLSQTIAQQTPLSTEPQKFVTEAAPTIPFKGDLTTYLPLDPLFTQWLPKPDELSQHTTHQADDGASNDASGLFDDKQIPVALVGTSYSANPHWNFLGALQEAIGADIANFSQDGHGPILPMLEYLQSDDFKSHPPQVVIWEFPERYLPVQNDLSKFDSKWIAQLKSAPNEPLAVNTTSKTETPDRAHN